MESDALDYREGLPDTARILVTGGSGFIGTNLVNEYRSRGLHVVNADASGPRDPASRDVFRQTDLLRPDDVTALFNEVRPTHVFHLASRTDLDGDSVGDYAINVQGVSNLIDALRAAEPVERVVVTSSRMVCKIGYQPQSDTDFCPSTPYGESKVETERLVREASDLPWVMGRPTSIWGPWFDVPYRDFFLSIAKGRYVHPRGRRIQKNFGYVGNTTWQLHKLMTAPSDGVLHRVFYLADNPPIEVRDFADRISRELGQRKAPNVPLPLLRGIAVAGDLLERSGRRAPLTSFRLDNLLTDMPYALEPMEEVAGEPPIGLDEAIATTVEWMREQRLV